MNRVILERYAEVIIRSGINLQPGQPVLLRADVVQREFALELAKAAYSAGASLVSVKYADGKLSRLRIDKTQSDKYFDFVPSHIPFMYEKIVEDGWATISLRGPEDPDLMEGADPAKIGRAGKAVRNVMQGFMKAVSSNQLAWNVCLCPTSAWAEKVLCSSENWEERIWDVLIPILRLDYDDPAAAWLEHDATLKSRAEYMNARRFDRIRFEGPGTDLVVGMAPNRLFVGGRCINSSGIPFFPNIPTEEIFATPDHSRTEGHVKCTRPVEVLGTQVQGAWFEFEKGRVVEFGADEHRDILARFMEFDAGASALGEVALVGTDSPIYRSGKIFHNILFDENAACHIALGNGYTDCIEGGTKMSPEELAETRCNVSLVHTDFMIGSDEISVFGIHADGSEEEIINNGMFTIGE